MSESIEVTKAEPNPYAHYFRDVRHLDKIDIYRVAQLFDVSDPALQHALKKIMAAGRRGAKDSAKDVGEAIVALRRWQEMRSEERLASDGSR